jgi:hypothetical protein
MAISATAAHTQPTWLGRLGEESWGKSAVEIAPGHLWEIKILFAAVRNTAGPLQYKQDINK